MPYGTCLGDANKLLSMIGFVTNPAGIFIEIFIM